MFIRVSLYRFGLEISHRVPVQKQLRNNNYKSIIDYLDVVNNLFSKDYKVVKELSGLENA